MTSRDFCYWLQGYFVLAAGQTFGDLTKSQCDSIQRHLALVFKHEINPSFGSPDKQKALNDIHYAPKKHDLNYPPMVRC